VENKYPRVPIRRVKNERRSGYGKESREKDTDEPEEIETGGECGWKPSGP